MNLSKELNTGYIEVSAKTGTNIEELIDTAYSQLNSLLNLSARPSNAARSSSAIPRPEIQLKSKIKIDKILATPPIVFNELLLPLGYIEKRGYWSSAYKVRWFILRGEGMVQYFTSRDSSEMKGSFSLKDSTVEKGGLKESDPDYVDQDRCFIVRTSYREWRFRAENPETALHWCNLLDNYKKLVL
jgi:hypothetical protein